MPQLPELDNRVRIPPYVWRYFCRKAWAEGLDPRELVKDLILQYTFGTAERIDKIPTRTPSNVIPQRGETVKFESTEQLLEALLDTDELFNWD